uniref:Uncharacterized protein n=1 Tax=Eutreptiella gymnastica TaxID=73025 RepID=A0A7S1ITF4_9EUGL|mmetsp:Transcript_40936/g.73306  ORF Transcript_40936/g.73306 Transcript_40936/m.73306 type:complete len:673 (+) Transcript_40936:60-2078(+)
MVFMPPHGTDNMSSKTLANQRRMSSCPPIPNNRISSLNLSGLDATNFVPCNKQRPASVCHVHLNHILHNDDFGLDESPMTQEVESLQGISLDQSLGFDELVHVLQRSAERLKSLAYLLPEATQLQSILGHYMVALQRLPRLALCKWKGSSRGTKEMECQTAPELVPEATTEAALQAFMKTFLTDPDSHFIVYDTVPIAGTGCVDLEEQGQVLRHVLEAQVEQLGQQLQESQQQLQQLQQQVQQHSQMEQSGRPTCGVDRVAAQVADPRHARMASARKALGAATPATCVQCTKLEELVEALQGQLNTQPSQHLVQEQGQVLRHVIEAHVEQLEQQLQQSQQQLQQSQQDLRQSQQQLQQQSQIQQSGPATATPDTCVQCTKLEELVETLQGQVNTQRSQHSVQIIQLRQEHEKQLASNAEAVIQMRRREETLKLEAEATAEQAQQFRDMASELYREQEGHQEALRTVAKLKGELKLWESKEAELVRLRTLMRFSQLKRDSDQLHATNAETKALKERAAALEAELEEVRQLNCSLKADQMELQRLQTVVAREQERKRRESLLDEGPADKKGLSPPREIERASETLLSRIRTIPGESVPTPTLGRLRMGSAPHKPLAQRSPSTGSPLTSARLPNEMRTASGPALQQVRNSSRMSSKRGQASGSLFAGGHVFSTHF